MTDAVYKPVFSYERLNFYAEAFRTPRQKTANPHLERAAGWCVAQIRGNNACSDDKAIHRALDELSVFLGVEKQHGKVCARLDHMLVYQDSLGPIGRAVIVACWVLRGVPIGNGVDSDMEAWQLISEAESMEAV